MFRPLLLAAFTLTSTAAAQSLTTTFANNNAGTLNWTNFFDLQINNPFILFAVDCNATAANLTGTVDVYITDGTTVTTHVGNEQLPVWTQIATGLQTVSNPSGTPTTVCFDFTSPPVFNPGTFGVAMHYSGGFGPVYTNGNGQNQTYSNPDMTLTAGTSTSNAPGLAGTLFTPRVWNGTLYYNGFSKAEVIGRGCGAVVTGGDLTLATDRPVSNTTVNINTSNISGNAIAGAVLFGFQGFNPGLDLTGIGMPGCILTTSGTVSLPFTPAGSTNTQTVNIGMPGIVTHLQSATIVPGANPLGVTTSNGIRWTTDFQ